MYIECIVIYLVRLAVIISREAKRGDVSLVIMTEQIVRIVKGIE